jgi:branched-subunit amino acid transport system permease
LNRQPVLRANKIRAAGPWDGQAEEVEDAARILQLLNNSAASGCIYRLIALGFVLIYRATEMVNLAHGDVIILGGFVALT